MVAARTFTRSAIALLLAAAPAVWYACAERSSGSPTGPAPSAQRSAQPQPRGPDLRGAIAAQRRHTDALLKIPGVVGTAVGLRADGQPEIQILLERPGVAALPAALDGIPVSHRVTGRLVPFSDPTQRQRPAPTGFSVGHPAVTAGTIGARVRDALGRVYILSNNHVLANSNNAQIGDAAYQPGPFDGGTAADQIATLTDFQPITFTGTANNTIDAAIALSSTALLDNAVPSDDGYGMPNATIYGDANGDGQFDDPSALLGLNVQKYGRTTRLTRGQITGVSATVSVCYEGSGLSCTKLARFVDQLIISPGTFSGGGDSGSLIVTDDVNVNAVGLLFAGSGTITVANRIDLVLARFGVAIDGFAPPPPGPLTDVAVTGVSVTGAVVVNSTATVTMTVKNFGNQDVSGFDVTLEDTTEHVTVGTQAVAGLVAGAATTVTIAWTPTTAGTHDLVGRHTLSDDKSTNDARSVTITVAPMVTDVAVTGLSVSGSVIQGHVVNVAVTVSNTGNQNVTSNFDVTLQDATAGVTLGTETLSGGLAAGAATTRTFNWDLTSAALGGHTLVATHGLADDNVANNQRTAAVTVSPKPTDLALTGITAPARVTVGDTAHVLVTVKNVGEVDVATSFDVVLTDGTTGGVTVGTQTLAGLAIGATATLDFPWNTAGAATNGHILVATQRLVDNTSTNNSIAIAIYVLPPPDVAVTGMSVPAAVIQGSTPAIDVTVQNVGGQHINTSFAVVLTDATAGVTIGTQTIPWLVMGATATRTFNWNTAGAALGSHTLVATHSFTDATATNNQASATVTVNPPATDVAVTNVTAPATVPRGNTATIGVTVQNVAVQNVSTSFNVVLTDATTGVTVGTQAVSGLAVGASTTRFFSWNTASAALGAHTLVARHSLTDDYAANNQRSATVNVTPQPADLALAAITAPRQVTVGDTAPVVVTVQNVGGQDVTTNFDVVLTDGTAGGVTIGTQSIPGLAMGASVMRTFNWNTAGVATSTHILTATQKLADNDASNNARAVAIIVDPPSVHVGDLDGVAVISGDVWSATVQITVHDVKHNPATGVTVRGTWNDGFSSRVAECLTNQTEGNGGGTGICVVVLSAIPIATRTVSFGVTGLTLSGAVYKAAMNHDPDGSSNGFSIYVKQP